MLPSERSLARVLVHDPDLLLLDEPASGLDPRARIELMQILQELRRLGKTIFISSHILSELAELCDSVTILDRGTVKYTGAMRDLLARRDDGDGQRHVRLLQPRRLRRRGPALHELPVPLLLGQNSQRRSLTARLRRLHATQPHTAGRPAV